MRLRQCLALVRATGQLTCAFALPIILGICFRKCPRISRCIRAARTRFTNSLTASTTGVGAQAESIPSPGRIMKHFYRLARAACFERPLFHHTLGTGYLQHATCRSATGTSAQAVGHQQSTCQQPSIARHANEHADFNAAHLSCRMIVRGCRTDLSADPPASKAQPSLVQLDLSYNGPHIM